MAAANEVRSSRWRLNGDAPHALGLLAVAHAASVAVTTLDVLLARGAIDLGRFLALDYQRVSGLLSLAVFAAAGLVLELFLAALLHRMGRGLETRLRVALLARAASGLLVTTLAIALLQPRAFGWALAAALLSVVVPLAVQRPLTETSLRLRTQGAALDRFYLDALLGVSPIRIHGAERAVCREHEALLADWARTGRTMQAQSARLSAVQLCTGTRAAGHAERPVPTSGAGREDALADPRARDAERKRCGGTRDRSDRRQS